MFRCRKKSKSLDITCEEVSFEHTCIAMYITFFIKVTLHQLKKATNGIKESHRESKTDLNVCQKNINRTIVMNILPDRVL